MGNLLKLWYKAPTETGEEVFLDFENAQPSPAEKEIFDLTQSGMETCDELIDQIKNYEGAEAHVKIYMKDSSNPEAIEGIKKSIIPLVVFLKRSYQVSRKFEEIFPKLMTAIASDTDGNPFEEKQALCRILAQLLDFSITFDNYKVQKPSIQNDFSFYRRCISKVGSADDNPIKIIEDVQGEMVNNILLFIASPNPFMYKLLTSVQQGFTAESSPSIDQVTAAIARLTRICKSMVETWPQENESQDAARFRVLKVMVATIVLYDNVHHMGVFVKNSPIDIRHVVKIIKDENSDEQALSLLNTIQFSTKHLNDVNTPPNIKQLFQ